MKALTPALPEAQRPLKRLEKGTKRPFTDVADASQEIRRYLGSSTSTLPSPCMQTASPCPKVHRQSLQTQSCMSTSKVPAVCRQPHSFLSPVMRCTELMDGSAGSLCPVEVSSSEDSACPCRQYIESHASDARPSIHRVFCLLVTVDASAVSRLVHSQRRRKPRQVLN